MLFVLSGEDTRVAEVWVGEVWEVDPESLSDSALAAHVRELDAHRSRVEAAMAQRGGRGRRSGRVGL